MTATPAMLIKRQQIGEAASWSLVLTELAGEDLVRWRSPHRVYGGDAGFEEARATKGQTNRLHVLRGLGESRHDEWIGRRLAIPIRPLSRVRHVSRDGPGLLHSGNQLQTHWVGPPERG